MLKKIGGGRPSPVWDSVTGDETWIFQYDLENKAAIGCVDHLGLGHIVALKFKLSKSDAKHIGRASSLNLAM